MSHDLTCGCPACEHKAQADYFAQMDMEPAPDDEATCPECEGDGGDKWNDYALPCPTCGGDGRLTTARPTGVRPIKGHGQNGSVIVWLESTPSGRKSKRSCALPPLSLRRKAVGDFAKIVKASDGEQVLFYKAQDDEGRPQLRQITEMEGCTGELNLGFKPEEWDALDSAFDKADVAQADAVREQFRKFFEGESRG